MLQKAGQIASLERQVSFELIPAQKKSYGQTEGRCSYKADFVYIDMKTGERVVEDVKGFRTKEYIIKRKLMLFMHNIEIKEI